MESPLGHYNHPAWITSAATAVSYGLILTFLFILLFVIPYLLFAFVV